jgi:hypothetical protein
MAGQVSRGSAAAAVGGGAVVGAVGGASTAKATWPDKLIDVYADILDKHGLTVVVVLLVVPSTLWLVAYLLRRTLDRSDEEIERLVEEKNRLYDEVLVNRPTSTTAPVRRSVPTKRSPRGSKGKA